LRHAYQMRQNYKSILTTDRNEAFREGKQEGEVKGKLEGKLETAREMKRMELAQEIIEKATGLDRSQMEQL
jgi:predicted transposase/invertase (TIGR01784 family)